MMLFLFIQAATPLPAIACAPGLRDERHASAGLHLSAYRGEEAASPSASQCRADRAKEPQRPSSPAPKAVRTPYTA